MNIKNKYLFLILQFTFIACYSASYENTKETNTNVAMKRDDDEKINKCHSCCSNCLSCTYLMALCCKPEIACCVCSLCLSSLALQKLLRESCKKKREA